MLLRESGQRSDTGIATEQLCYALLWQAFENLTCRDLRGLPDYISVPGQLLRRCAYSVLSERDCRPTTATGFNRGLCMVEIARRSQAHIAHAIKDESASQHFSLCGYRILASWRAWKQAGGWS